MCLKYTPLKFQEKSIDLGIKFLIENNGLLITDETGLGKTIVSSFIAAHFAPKNLLIIAPKSMQKSWAKVLITLNINHTITTFQTLIEKPFDFIIIDEAHNLSSSKSQRFKNWFKLIHRNNPKTILNTATPFNNNFTEFFDMLSLIPFRVNSVPFVMLHDLVDKVKNVEKQQRVFDTFKKNNHSMREYADRCLLDKVLDRYAHKLQETLKYFCIRNTRAKIFSEYKSDFLNIGTFPKIKRKDILRYESDSFQKAANKTLHLLSKMPLVLQTIDKYSDNAANTQGFKGLYKSFLLKRLDSSIYAFKKSIQKSLNVLVNIQKEFKGGVVIIDNKTFVVDNIFWEGLDSDIDYLQQIIDTWQDIDDSKKIEVLLQNVSDKTLIFSEYKDTIEMLAQAINNPKKIVYTSDTPTKVLDLLESDFNANADKQTNKYEIALLTDVVSEGVSLHRADTIIHFDSRWNPARHIQRNGRIDRISTTTQKDISILSFGVDTVVEAIIGLESKRNKKQNFADTILDINNNDLVNYKDIVFESGCLFGLQDENIYQRFTAFKNDNRVFVINNDGVSNLITKELDLVSNDFDYNFKKVVGDRDTNYDIKDMFYTTYGHLYKTIFLNRLKELNLPTHFLLKLNNKLYNDKLFAIFNAKNKKSLDEVTDEVIELIRIEKPIFCQYLISKSGVMYQGQILI